MRKSVVKDKLDGFLVAWWRAKAAPGDRCKVCSKGYRRGQTCYTERVLPGLGARPHTTHIACFAVHVKRTRRDARRQAKAVELADKVF